MVKRYSLDYDDGIHEDADEGEWVSLGDYEKLERHMFQIVKLLGPEKFGCSECKCQGCEVEGNEALRCAKMALAGEDWFNDEG